MNRLQDYFDEDDAGDDVTAGPLFQGMPHDPSAPFIEGIDYLYNPQAAREAGGPFTHDVYGQQKSKGEPAADTGDVSAGPLFQGMRHDPSAPLVDFAARDHSPALKAWLDQEPLGYVDGLNVYAAPVDDPVNRVDPLGT